MTASPKKPQQTSLYAEHCKVQPRRVDGRFRTLKWIATGILLTIFFLGPWLRWSRGAGVPDQAILLDLAGRRGYFFSIEIWPQEVYYLTGILILGAVGLFLATSLWGRLWCGFTCIQTVFTDLFQWIEYRTEGDRSKRLSLDSGPWTSEKFTRKTIKIVLWLVVSFLTSATFLLYFSDAFVTTMELLHGSASSSFYSALFLIMASTFLLAGFAREQVCIYMCPWPRFQAAMVDEDSLIVTYEGWRGEPRGTHKRGQLFENRGHCIDCTMCVQVCPTGVDIRNGSQLACIGCALCIDACDQVMDKIGLPRGLISYDSSYNLAARGKGTATRRRPIRPRTLMYTGVLLLVVAVMGGTLVTRSRLEVDVLHERSPLYVTMSNGATRNGYTIKVLNMSREDQVYTLRTEGLPQASVDIIGYTATAATTVELPVKGDSVGTFRVYVTVPRGQLVNKTQELRFVLTEQRSGRSDSFPSIFAGSGE
ncbi:MAG: cytochrome c oxidase accessory protein CcoG [Alphaproteobacteria bacterium]|nr:cytochrome c oxidase accessory protein CcoG [Alphaproteobacteria bacterium]